MYLDISKNERAFDQTFKFSFDQMQPLSFDYNGQNYTFIKFSFCGSYTVLREMIEVSGKIDCVLQTICDRCLDPARFDVDFYINEIFKRQCDREEVYLYTSNKIDLNKSIMDNIILNLPMYSYCKKDCKGICEYCGANLNNVKCDCYKENLKSSSPFAVLEDLFGKEV